MSSDPHDLNRFVSAQRPVFERVLAELRAGRKTSHWMWFVFPQARGLGQSAMSLLYGIASLDEARAYLAHPTLGPRLGECVALVTAAQAASLRAIFGTPDDLKFRSSMTLFALAANGDGGVYQRALARWCEGRRDERTLRLFGA